jgi:hypothetical protein
MAVENVNEQTRRNAFNAAKAIQTEVDKQLGPPEEGRRAEKQLVLPSSVVRGKVAARKAIVAVARKLTTRMYAVLKEQRPFVIRPDSSVAPLTAGETVESRVRLDAAQNEQPSRTIDIPTFIDRLQTVQIVVVGPLCISLVPGRCQESNDPASSRSHYCQSCIYCPKLLSGISWSLCETTTRILVAGTQLPFIRIMTSCVL